MVYTSTGCIKATGRSAFARLLASASRRVRRTMRATKLLGIAALLSAALAQTLVAQNKHVVFVLGDHEYSGELTIPPIAAELERNYGLRCTVLKSAPDQNGEKD